jgi:V8-like Glu-specific endopeptidase
MKPIATWASLLSLSLLQLACSADDLATPVAASESAVLGGTAVTAGQFPTVVALHPIPNALCTGTLIAPDVVLTAAHCVSYKTLGLGSQDQVAPGMTVSLDTQSGLFGGRTIHVLKAIPMPEFNTPGTPDLGIVKLAEKITDRPFVAVNLDPTKLPAGSKMTMVGYGMTDPNNMSSAGQERTIDKDSTTCAAFGVSDSTFTCIMQMDAMGICEGDSGGPAFAMVDGVQKQVAVNSATAQGCVTASLLMRTDAGKAFLLANAPEAFCLADDTCNTVCGKDGLPVDPDCKTCSGTDDCDSGQVCAQNVCIPGPGTPGGAGSTCTSGADCDSNTCGQVGDEMKCTSECTPGASTCPDGFDCLPTSGTSGACWPGAGADDGGKSGGCSVSAGRRGADAAGGSLALLVLVGGVIAVRRRRRAA